MAGGRSGVGGFPSFCIISLAVTRETSLRPSGGRSELCSPASFGSESSALVSEVRLLSTAQLFAELAVYVAKVDKWW